MNDSLADMSEPQKRGSDPKVAADPRVKSRKLGNAGDTKGLVFCSETGEPLMKQGDGLSTENLSNFNQSGKENEKPSIGDGNLREATSGSDHSGNKSDKTRPTDTESGVAASISHQSTNKRPRTATFHTDHDSTNHYIYQFSHVKYMIQRQLDGVDTLIEEPVCVKLVPPYESRCITISDLPTSLILRIFSHLTVHQLLHTACLVCKQWYHLTLDPELWRVINLQGQVKVSDDVLDRLTSYSQNVTELDITDARLVTGPGVAGALEKCKTLKVLKLIRCQHLTEPAYQAIGLHLNQLEQIYLDNCYGLSDPSLCVISKGCKQLSYLSINACARISDSGIEAVATSCPKLKVLRMDLCTRVTDHALQTLAKHCLHLEGLCCLGCSFTNAGLAVCAQLKNLKMLVVPNIPQLTGAPIIQIAKHCLHLNTLNLCLCPSITDQCVEAIARHARNLENLHLVSCNVSDKALLSLYQYCRKLKQLDIGWCKNITSAGVELVSCCPTLQYLGLMRCDAVTLDTINDLVEQHPNITYSTLWLDCQRLIHRAQQRSSPMYL